MYPNISRSEPLVIAGERQLAYCAPTDEGNRTQLDNLHLCSYAKPLRRKEMKKLSLGLALAFLMLATLAYAQSGNPTDNPTVASWVVSNLKSLSPGSAGNEMNRCLCLRATVFTEVFTISSPSSASIPESVPNPGCLRFHQSDRLFRPLTDLGNPRPSIANIVPYNGGVYVNVNAGTGNPIDVRLDILIAP